MCPLNYNRNRNKYKHLTYQERLMIERWINKDNKSNTEIAELLDKSDRTIRRERKRGKVVTRDILWREVEQYSGTVAKEAYEYNLRDKGKDLKIGSNLDLVDDIKRLLIDEKKSVFVN